MCVGEYCWYYITYFLRMHAGVLFYAACMHGLGLHAYFHILVLARTTRLPGRLERLLLQPCSMESVQLAKNTVQQQIEQRCVLLWFRLVCRTKQ